MVRQISLALMRQCYGHAEFNSAMATVWNTTILNTISTTQSTYNQSFTNN